MHSTDIMRHINNDHWKTVCNNKSLATNQMTFKKGLIQKDFPHNGILLHSKCRKSSVHQHIKQAHVCMTLDRQRKCLERKEIY